MHALPRLSPGPDETLRVSSGVDPAGALRARAMRLARSVAASLGGRRAARPSRAADGTFFHENGGSARGAASPRRHSGQSKQPPPKRAKGHARRASEAPIMRRPFLLDDLVLHRAALPRKRLLQLRLVVDEARERVVDPAGERGDDRALD